MGMRLSLAAVEPDQLARLVPDESTLIKLLLRPPSDSTLCMDKEWHGIHFLLTGDPWSTDSQYGAAVFGGTEFGPDLSYGPARVLAPDQVSEITLKLKGVSIDELRSRYDPVAMTEAQIYPDVWEREGREALEWLLAGYLNMREFYARAAAQGKAVILAIL